LHSIPKSFWVYLKLVTMIYKWRVTLLAIEHLDALVVLWSL